MVEVAIPEAVRRANRINEISKKKKNLDFNNLPLEDRKTWDLISSGFTKGVFQLEKQLGKRFSKEIKPRSIDELADVISLIRPGCLEAEFREKPDNPGKFYSITDTYIKVRNGELEPEYLHPCLEPILAPTNSVPIYQEQLMRICTDFAGFTLKEADDARKAIGKKLKDKMEEVKQKFISGAAKQGHDPAMSEQIFGWIDKFSGYGFNKSHAISYALVGYQTAYAKAHFPLYFFKAMLNNSDSKADSLEEIHELVHEARLFNININPPCLKLLNVDFAKQDEKTIAFGLSHIKGVGPNAIESVKKISKVSSSSDFLAKIFGGSVKVRKDVAEALIKSGALDYLNPNRILVLAEFKILQELTDRELKFVLEQVEGAKWSIHESVNKLIESNIPNKTRKPKIAEALVEVNKNLTGSKKRISIGYEKHYLGIPLSGSLVELYHNDKVNTKCRDFNRLKNDSWVTIGVVIEEIRKLKDKNGNHMCFLKVSDDTYMLDSVVIFASQYNKIGWILEEGKPVLISGKKDKKGSLSVNAIDHL